MNEVISIIVPVYNVAPYLEKCLNSIKKQTYTNLEVLCVDDGSTDDSGKILDAFAKEDARFRVFHQKNQGTGSARNLALEHITGDYIGFVDPDDWIEPEMFEMLHDSIKKTGTDIVTCGYYMDKEDGSAVWMQNRKKVSEDTLQTKDFLKYIYCRDEYKGVGGYLWTRLFRVQVIEGAEAEEPIRFEETLIPGQDVYFIAKSCVRAKTMVYLSIPLYHYVQRTTSVMHQSEKRLEKMSSCKAYEMSIEFFEKERISKKTVDLLKRFYVYHASILLEVAYRRGDVEKIQILKRMIRKYLVTYIRTNLLHPTRIQGIFRSLIGKY